jgi:hypothetical protein
VTAVAQYQRLETTGLWRVGSAQRREVVVALGDASLTLRDPHSDMALAHWSLPALVRARGNDSADDGAVLFRPGPDSDEVLEISDPDMIAALDRVGRVVRAAAPRPGHLRRILTVSVVAAVAGAVAYLGPPVVVRQTAGAVPQTEREAIAQSVLTDLSTLTGAPCAAAAGSAALAGLGDRLLGQGHRIVILRAGLTAPLALPDGSVALPVAMLGHDSPHLLAGAALAARQQAAVDDPLIPVLSHAGVGATLRLMTSGRLPVGAIAGYGEVVLRQAQAAPDNLPLLAAMQAAGVSPAPYGWWRDPTGVSTLTLIEAARGTEAPLMSPADWQALRTICDG